jgi:hypothetical protein
VTQDIPLPHYYACLLRVWRENDADPWRVLIQHARSDEQLLFSDLLAAFAFIEAQLGKSASLGPPTLQDGMGESPP